MLEPYPPGIPLLLPGERVTPAVVDAWRASGRDPRSTPLEALYTVAEDIYRFAPWESGFAPFFLIDPLHPDAYVLVVFEDDGEGVSDLRLMLGLDGLRAAWGEAVFRYDLTEVPGLDNLAHPEGALAASMAAWAEARGCAHVQYLLGGTSLGLKAAMLGLCRGRKVFVPRHAHTSIYQGMVLAGAEPVTLDVSLDDALGIPLGVSPETLARAIAAHPDCRHSALRMMRRWAKPAAARVRAWMRATPSAMTRGPSASSQAPAASRLAISR